MNNLIKQFEDALPKSMTMPKPLKQLYKWIIENNLYINNQHNYTIGFLYPNIQVLKDISQNKHNYGTLIQFSSYYNLQRSFWFNQRIDEVESRLFIFAQMGFEAIHPPSATGSYCALWLDDDNQLKVVYMSNGLGTGLECIIADNAIDFLRLLAMGYDADFWNIDLPYPPNENNRTYEYHINPNVKFQKWVKYTFNVDIPKTGTQVVKNPTSIWDEKFVSDENSESGDAFCNWVEKVLN